MDDATCTFERTSFRRCIVTCEYFDPSGVVPQRKQRTWLLHKWYMDQMIQSIEDDEGQGDAQVVEDHKHFTLRLDHGQIAELIETFDKAAHSR